MVPINTRLKLHEAAYILQHSGASLILVDYEYTHLIQGTQIPFIVSKDTGRSGDPYETFLSRGREFSAERGWLGLDTTADENAPSTLCYTCVAGSFPCPPRPDYLAVVLGRPDAYVSCSTFDFVYFILTQAQPKGVLTTLRGNCLSMNIIMC